MSVIKRFFCFAVCLALFATPASAGSSASRAWSFDTSGPGVANEFFASQLGVFPNVNGPYQMTVTTSGGVLYDNLAASTAGADPIDSVTGIGPISNSFSTLDVPVFLTDVKVLLELSAPPTGSVIVSLLSDNSTSPGALLTTIGSVSDSVIPTVPTAFDFPVAPFALDANTRYWIQLSAIPEPSSVVLLGTGAAAIVLFGRRPRSRKARSSNQ
jgi:hypothetical protein